MTIIEKHKGNLRDALFEEIGLLAKSDILDKSRMNIETFDPLSPTKCYVGQIFGYASAGANTHRKAMGGTPVVEGSQWRIPMMGGMTPLETWAAENWRDKKGDVQAVFNYIKSGGTTPLPEIVFE